MLEVTVDRTKWYRGKGSIHSALLTDEGEMCCLGFACLAAGMTPEQIKGMKAPVDLARHRISLPDSLSALLVKDPEEEDSEEVERPENSDICQALMKINDSKEKSEQNRENSLREESLEAGIRFKFVG